MVAGLVAVAVVMTQHVYCTAPPSRVGRRAFFYEANADVDLHGKARGVSSMLR